MRRKLGERQYVVKTKERAPRTAAGDAIAALAIRVMMTAGYLTEAGDALTKPLKQSSARWQVLAGAAKGDMSVAQIARALGVSRQAVQRIADLLEADGLARYLDNPAHARAKLLVLTSEGHATLGAIRSRQTLWANDLGAEFEENALLQARQTIDKLLALLKARNPELS